MLFQPSNIIPDEINGSGCIDAAQDLSVSWQVNGDSAMTAYEIVICRNNPESTQLYTTGKVALSTPFWGVNYKGQTQFFTASIAASALSGAGITNGNEYKLLITQWWSANNSITQTTASLFLTRSTPTVTITAIPSPLTVREYSFTGNYSQAQGDAIKWVRWQIAVEGREDAPFLDTGEIGGTGELQVDYAGFFNGTTYTINLTIETENGQTATSGWVEFAVSYTVTEPQGSVSACQIQNSSAVSVQWTQQEAAQGYDIFRQRVGESVLVKLASVDATTGQLRDYGAKSGESYVYYVFPTGVLSYLTEPMVSDELAVNLWFWSIIEAEEDENGDFSVQKLHLFRYGSGGVQEGAFSNNNSPSLQKNFTQYPTRQGESADYLSGSVSGYIGTISTVGGKTYSDTLEMAADFRALSTTDNALFLLDPKGHFLRIATSGEISMTINHKSPVRPVTITVPWVEIDSTEGVPLVAAPGGSFYPVDNIIFTTVRVDPESGLLLWTHDEDYSEGSILELKDIYSPVEITETAGGAVASFETEISAPAKALSVSIEPVQSGSGDPSPDNVRPISGWTGLTVWRTGKNLCGESFNHGNFSDSNGLYYSHEGAATRYVSVGIIPVKGGQTYTLSWEDDPNNIAVAATAVFYNSGSIAGYKSLSGQKTFMTPENADGVALNLLAATSITSISQISISKPQLELGSTATSYEPYAGNTYTIDLNGTRYGGTFDVTTGVLTVDRVKRHFAGDEDLWSVGVGAGSGCNRATIQLSDAKRGTNAMQIWSDIFRYVASSKTPLWAGLTNNNAVLLLGVPTSITDRAEMNAWAAENPFDIVYYLDTPLTYQLTPTEVQLFLGENNVWADTGDVEVEYVKSVVLLPELMLTQIAEGSFTPATLTINDNVLTATTP